MNLKLLLVTGRVPPIHPAAMFLFIAFLLTSLLLKKSFCSWLCPVGTLSEYIWQARPAVSSAAISRLPALARHPAARAQIPAARLLCLRHRRHVGRGAADFMQTPYGLIADVKMLNFFRGMSLTAAIVIVVLVASVHARRELLVPLSLPLRCAHGPGLAAQPVQNSPRPDSLHRLRQMRHAPAPRLCPSTSWCRFAPSSARPAWPASPPARRKRAAICASSAPAPRGRAAPFPPCPAAARHGRASSAHLFRNHSLRPRHQSLANRCAPRSVYMELIPHANSLTHPGM